MSDKLKPCPFCGSKSIDAEGWRNNEGVIGPACDDCGASAGDISHDSQANIAAWNKRTPSPEREAKLAALEEKILIWESDGVFLLKGADKMAAVCDDWVKRKIIDERSALADARLEYCDPYTFGLEKMRAALMEMDRPPDATPEITKPYICANCQDGNHHWCQRIIHEPENNNECTCDCIKTEAAHE